MSAVADALDAKVVPGLREWVTLASGFGWTVILGSLVTFFFTFFFYGWASLQALLEADGVYLAVCAPEEPLCAERTSRMILLYTVDNLVTVVNSAVMAMAVDRVGPAVLALLGGLLQAAALFLMALSKGSTSTPFDGFLAAFILSGIGGSTLMVQSMRLAFAIQPRFFATIMTAMNCLVDSSAVTPLGLYRLYLLGMSRFSIFAGYGIACLVLSVSLAFCWCGSPLQILKALNAEELKSAELSATKEGNGSSRPRLHGLPVREQVWSLEFAFAGMFLSTQLFRSNAYLGICKDLLQSLGDVETNNLYTQILSALLPASALLLPVFDLCMSRGGFVFTFGVVLSLGAIWGVVVLIPSLQLQLLAFLAFTNYRALLFGVFFTFLGHSFGNRTFGRISCLCYMLSAGLSWLIWPLSNVSKQLGGDLTFMNGFLLLLGLLPIWMVILLARHLRRFPTGDLRAKPDNKKVEWEEEGTVFDSVLVGASREVTARPLRSLWRRCFGYLA
ncbi:SLC43A1 [Symbiodinium natans]|uniref:SLC43A1 protein n=1 Tax=Symbiodinium natans TaxID=878477 RepID=A0A812MV99_9DINO|nr:SLC43A1 [Symbiodinium natans]